MQRTSARTVKVTAGALVSHAGRPCTVIALLDLSQALLRDHRNGQTVRVRLDQIGPAMPPTRRQEVMNAPDLATVAAEDWKEAQRRLALIRPLLGGAPRTLEAVRARARKGGVHPATLYRWIERFEATGKTSALLPTKPEGGRSKGRLNAEVEALTQVTIQEVYLTPQRLSARKVGEEVARRCRATGLEAPHERTVRRRIAQLSEGDRLKARHGRQAAEVREAVPGEFTGADFPLAVVQIDHTKLDLILVDEAGRQSIGRPWITLSEHAKLMSH